MMGELIQRWNSFIRTSIEEMNHDYTEKDHEQYKQLLIDSFNAIRSEWNQETVSKDLCRLLIVMDRFGEDNVFFHRAFLKDYLENDQHFQHLLMESLLNNKLIISEEGMININGVAIDTNTFDVDYWQLNDEKYRYAFDNGEE